MDEKSLYAHILNLTASWQVKALSLDEKVGSVTVTVGIAEKRAVILPRPAVKPALYMITGIVNGAISIPASSPP
ncbi:transposase, ISL3 family [Klebsiella pneumoniae]|uniref:Transposase, ISL3 family n=1 Tax=Klebsiella pneumoniae TaxID=573 RepID=A0A2X3CHQ8_KLEPN|nr:transposase, ISL3 family [Klebsiella pneumoniae]